MILPSPTAPDGLVATLASYAAKDFPPGCAVLCRNTAPLVGHAYGLLQRDVPCRILGRDIGAQLRTIVEKMRATTLDDLVKRLRIWQEREAAKLISTDRSPERIYDQHQCLTFFINGLDEDSRTVASLLVKIDLMFSDAPAAGAVVLSTIHRAKGLEFPTVSILDRSLIPSRYAILPWQRQQETNLLYVAITRAQHTLYYINSNNWKDKQ